jgi:outer membrane protein
MTLRKPIAESDANRQQTLRSGTPDANGNLFLNTLGYKNPQERYLLSSKSGERSSCATDLLSSRFEASSAPTCERATEVEMKNTLTKRLTPARLIAGAACAALIATAVPAEADNFQAVDGTNFQLRIGGGVNMTPDYMGSDDYEAGFFPIIGIERDNGMGFTPRGFYVSPSVGVVGSRDPGDNPALRGLNETDFAVELGGKIGYEGSIANAFAALRYGVTGHNAFVGELGIDFRAEPADRWTLTGGPRATFASDDYFDTYFSVTPAEAARSGYAVFDAGSGLKSIGLEGEAVYNLTERTDVHFRASYERLQGDAADAPFVAGPGDENQFKLGVGVSHKIDLDFLNR